MCKLKNLKKFSASNNHIKELPENFNNLDNLESLYLSNNDLESLPSSFIRLKKIMNIDLDYNYLKNKPIFSGSVNPYISFRDNFLEKKKQQDDTRIEEEEERKKKLEVLSKPRKVRFNYNDVEKMLPNQATGNLRFDGFYIFYSNYISRVPDEPLPYHRILQFYPYGRVRSAHIPQLLESYEIGEFISNDVTSYIESINSQSKLNAQHLIKYFNSLWLANLQNECFNKLLLEDDCFANVGNYFGQEDRIILPRYSNIFLAKSLLGWIKKDSLDLVEVDGDDKISKFFEFVPFAPFETKLFLEIPRKTIKEKKYDDHYPFLPNFQFRSSKPPRQSIEITTRWDISLRNKY